MARDVGPSRSKVDHVVMKAIIKLCRLVIKKYHSLDHFPVNTKKQSLKDSRDMNRLGQDDWEGKRMLAHTLPAYI